MWNAIVYDVESKTNKKVVILFNLLNQATVAIAQEKRDIQTDITQVESLPDAT